jgi:hypothetical protein
MKRALVGLLSVAPALALGLSGCEKKKSAEGLPPATDWQAPAPVATGEEAPANPHAGMGIDPQGGADPHAGIDMSGAGGDPHAGVDMRAGSPHAGIDMSADSPHGDGAGVDVSKMGLPSPDPSRPVDASKFLKGVLKASPLTQAKMKPGGVIFISVRRAGPDGAPSGAPIAVERLTVGSWPVPFELTEANAMIGGTGFTGPVVVMARYDQDSDALSKQPGDVTGMVKASIPADKLTIALDTVLP